MDSWTDDATGSPAAASPGSSLRAMTLGEILDGMFRLVITHWRVYLLALGVVMIPYYILSTWLETQVIGFTTTDLFSAPALTELSGGSASAAVWLIVLRIVAVAALLPFTVGVACLIAAEAHEGRAPTTRGVWSMARRRFWRLLGLTLLMVIMTVVAVVILALLFGMAAATGSRAVAVVFGVLVALAVVGFATFFSLSYPALVIEDIGAGSAVGRSVSLVRGRFWRTLGTLLLVVIILNVMAFVVVFAITLPSFLFAEQGVLILALIGSVIAYLLVMPLLTNAVTLLYYDARVRDEAYDLDVRTQQIDPDFGSPPGQPFG